MTKIRNFAEITPNLPFTEYNFYEEFRGSFEKTEWGRMKKILPLREMAESLKLVNKSMMPKRGRKSYFFRSGDARESIPDRIVSVNKPYVRPIVRGKEVKNVEFGVKCNNILVDGISFIEKLSFNAFNEGTRLAHCIKMHRRLFGVDVQKGKKAKARLKMTEILYIFFGIHTANAFELSSRIAGLQPAMR